MSAHANFEIVRVVDLDIGGARLHALVIRDVGPWGEHLSVTNDIEHVIEVLFTAGALYCDDDDSALPRRLFYFDSEGELAEACIACGKFDHFGIGGSVIKRLKEALA